MRMDADWRRRQARHTRDARKSLEVSGSGRLASWQVIMMFYEVVVVVDGCAEDRGRPAPTGHNARRAFVKRNFPHLAQSYDYLYNESVAARYYDGYAMTGRKWREAVRSYEIIMASIPQPQAFGRTAGR